MAKKDARTKDKADDKDIERYEEEREDKGVDEEDEEETHERDKEKGGEEKEEWSEAKTIELRDTRINPGEETGKVGTMRGA